MANDDAECVRRMLAGQVNDYRVLVQRHQDSIYRFVRNIIGHRQEAEDVTQDVFVSAYKNLASFDSQRATFSTWLFTIARNRAINQLKSRRNETLVGSGPEPTDSHLPHDTVEERELLEQLNLALDALPVDQKTAFVLAEIEELSHGEIAAIEHISVGTVKSRVHRARQRLQAALQAFVRGA